MYKVYKNGTEFENFNFSNMANVEWYIEHMQNLNAEAKNKTCYDVFYADDGEFKCRYIPRIKGGKVVLTYTVKR